MLTIGGSLASTAEKGEKMIQSKMGKIYISGESDIIFAEFVGVIKGVYQAFAEQLGDERAREIIVGAGEAAFAPEPELDETLEKQADALMRLLEDGEENEVR